MIGTKLFVFVLLLGVSWCLPIDESQAQKRDSYYKCPTNSYYVNLTKLCALTGASRRALYEPDEPFVRSLDKRDVILTCNSTGVKINMTVLCSLLDNYKEERELAAQTEYLTEP